MLYLLHFWAILVFLPLSIFYLPAYTSPGIGVLTVRDIALAVIWCTTAILLLSRGELSSQERLCLQLSLFAILPAFLGILSSVTYDSASPLLKDFFVHLKRLGGSSVLAIAVSLTSQKQKSLLGKAAAVALLLAVLVPFTPVYNFLPQQLDAPSTVAQSESRNGGVFFNPNEFGIVAVLALAIALGAIAGPRARIWKIAACGAAAYAVITSASRGAMAALLCGSLLLIVKAKISSAARVAIVAVLALLIWTGLQFSESYKDRMERAVASSGMDENFAGRLDAQWIAINTGIHHPLGVGLVNIEAATSQYSSNSFLGMASAVATSDSIYIDYFVVTGVAGLACILLVFRLAWRLVSAERGGGQSMYLQAGVLGIAISGLSMLCPASVFTAPFFFFLVGLYPKSREPRQPGAVMARRKVSRYGPVFRVAR